MKNILLIGATGYLGIHILKELIDNTTSTVYCLIRGNNIEQRLTELLNYYFDEPIDKLIGTRIICVNGDTSKNNFGIEENEYNELGQKLDLVIHTAAIVKHQGNYDDFYNVNVLGTKRIIDFATMFNLKLGYMSTESVSGDYMVKQSNPLIDFTEQDFYIGQNFTENVYVRSKVESEKLILEAINNGLDVAIFRLGMIAARSSDGKFQINRNDNNFYNILRSMVNIKVFPTKILEQDIEFTPVDECAHGIIKVLQHTGSYKRVLHFYNQNYIKVKELYDIFTDILNLTIELIDVKNFAEYINVLKNKGVNENALAIVINNFNYEKILLDDNYRVKMNNTITQDYLRKIDFSWSKIDKDYFVTSKETLEDTEF